MKTFCPRAVLCLLGLILLSGCGDPEAEREALELAVDAAESDVLEAQMALNRYDGTAEIEELVAEKEADERALTAGDLPAAEFELRAAAREARLGQLLMQQENLDLTQDTTWLRLATVVEGARATLREAQEALDLFLLEELDGIQPPPGSQL
jgi:hypothetical protein